jgi:hypothetical protein
VFEICVDVLQTGFIFTDFSPFVTKCDAGYDGDLLQYFSEQKSGLNARRVELGFLFVALTSSAYPQQVSRLFIFT